MADTLHVPGAFMNIEAELIAKREKHGADTPVGHRISNLLEQLKELRTATGEQRQYLIRFIDNSIAEIKAMTPDQ